MMTCQLTGYSGSVSNQIRRTRNEGTSASGCCCPTFVWRKRSQWGAVYLLAVRNPDVFHLDSVVEEPAAFGLSSVEPVDGAAFVGEYLFQIPDRQSFYCVAAGFLREKPDGTHFFGFRDRFHPF